MKKSIRLNDAQLARLAELVKENDVKLGHNESLPEEDDMINEQLNHSKSDDLELEMRRNWKAIQAEIQTPEVKQSKSFNPWSFGVIGLAAAAAAALYIMTSSNMGTLPIQSGDSGYKGGQIGMLASCELELRSADTSFPVDGPQVKVGSTVSLGIVAKCSEPQFIHVQFKNVRGEVFQSLNQDAKISERQMLSWSEQKETVFGAPDIDAAGNSGSLEIVIVGTKGAVTSVDQVPWAGGAESAPEYWRQKFQVGR